MVYVSNVLVASQMHIGLLTCNTFAGSWIRLHT